MNDLHTRLAEAEQALADAEDYQRRLSGRHNEMAAAARADERPGTFEQHQADAAAITCRGRQERVDDLKLRISRSERNRA